MVCEHLVQFYDTEDELVEAVVPYLAAGLDEGEAVLVMATERHRLAFEQQLAATGRGIEQAFAAGTYVAVDASAILRYLRPEGGGDPSGEDFDATIGMLVRRHQREGRPLRVYGEVVGMLWDEGDVSGAIALEAMWNELQEQTQFKLFCGHPGPAATQRLEVMEHVCRAHSRVLPTIAGIDHDNDEAPISAEFGPSLASPRRVRALLRAALLDSGLDEDLIERGALAASELAANAVIHARTSFRLLIRPMATSVWIGVEDGAPLTGRYQVAGSMPHGLGIIAALAVRWGVRPRTTGKLVWAEIPQ